MQPARVVSNPDDDFVHIFTDTESTISGDPHIAKLSQNSVRQASYILKKGKS